MNPEQCLAVIEAVEQRFRLSGGGTTPIRPAEMGLIVWLEEHKRYTTAATQLRRHWLPRIRALRELVQQAVVEHVAFTLSSVKWKTQVGEELDISRMADTHIHNVIAMIVDGRMKRPGCNGLDNEQWLKVLRNELMIRRIREYEF